LEKTREKLEKIEKKLTRTILETIKEEEEIKQENSGIKE